MNRLPSHSQFSKLSVIDQSRVLEYHLREIEAEIDGLKSGYIWTTNGLTKERALLNVGRRLDRLKKLALEFGYWRDAA